MIYVGSSLRVADSSGGRTALCIRVLRKMPRGTAKAGDFIVVAIKRITPHKKVKKGEVHRALVIRDSFPLRRMDGSTIRFATSSCIVLKNTLPLAKRIFGPVPKELRVKGFIKVVSLATIAL